MQKARNRRFFLRSAFLRNIWQGKKARTGFMPTRFASCCSLGLFKAHRVLHMLSDLYTFYAA
jgi:hypothetical protein